MQIKYEDVNQELIDQEFDGMDNDGSSEPMEDLDYSSPQPELNAADFLSDFNWALIKN
jgi:hypothetical protein